MTRPPKEGPRIPGVTVYPRGKKWSFILYGEPDILTGKRDRTYEGGFDSDDAAWAAAIKAKSDMQTGRPARSTNLTVKQFFAEWLESIKDSVKPTTYANYVDNVDNVEAYIVPTIGHRKLKDIDVPY